METIKKPGEEEKLKVSKLELEAKQQRTESKDNQLEMTGKPEKERTGENMKEQIGETRERLIEQYKKEEKPEISDKLSPGELMEKAEKKNKSGEKTSPADFFKDNLLSENFLEERAEDMMMNIAGILQEIEDHLESLKEKVYMADLGSGRGHITEAILNRFKDSIGGTICIDLNVDLSKKVEKRSKINKTKMAGIKGDARETKLEDDSMELATALYLLQNLGVEDKLKAVKEMERIVKNGGYMLIVDEILQEGSKSLEDIVKHYFLNLFNPGKYEIFKEEEWREKVLDKISGEVVKFAEFGRNNFAALVKIRKEK